MRRIFKILSMVCVVIFLSIFCFSGCSKEHILRKAGKRLNNYDIDLVIDSKTMTAKGQEIFEYTNKNDTIIDHLVFHLYPTAFREDASVKPYSSVSEARCFPNGISHGDISISKVHENGENANYEIIGEDKDKLKVNLKNNLDISDKVTIFIEFNLEIPNCTHRYGYYENNINLGNFYPILSKYENGEYDLTPYYSTGDPFYSDCSNYKVSVTAPSEYKVFTSGVESKSSIQNDNMTCDYVATAVRDFAIVLGTNFEIESRVIDGTTINYVGYKGDENISKMADLSLDVVSWMSKNLKDYPYKQLNVIKTPFVHGGMEYPGLVMISDTAEENEDIMKIVAHEIAHEWWYGLVGVNETNHAWIDEGLSEYMTALFFKNNSMWGIKYDEIIKDATTSYVLYVDVISSINGKVNTKMNLPVNEYINEYEYTYMIYIKGTIMFDELAKCVGERKLMSALSKIAKNYSFENISEDEFTECIKHYTHIDTDGFFKGFLDGTAIIGKLH